MDPHDVVENYLRFTTHENSDKVLLKALLYQLSYTTRVVTRLELATDVVPTAFAAWLQIVNIVGVRRSDN